MKAVQFAHMMLPILVLLAWTDAAPAQDGKWDVQAVLKQIEAPRGLCVVLGDSQLALDVARKSELLVYVQSPDSKEVDSLRREAEAAGLLGTRLFVQQGSLSHIHLADNLADVIVLEGNTVKTVKQAEALRLLHPGGKLLGADLKVVATKPLPMGTDDWTHPYHGPDNNPQSRDRLARAPYLTHFTAEPWYCPMPLVTVSSNGRLFKAFGHIAVKEREWPWLNTLICQNAYNGAILWKRPLSDGFMIHRNTLIATPDVLYLGDTRSCKLLDTATGKLLDEIVLPKELGDGPMWKWMALVDGTLYALIGKEEPPDPTLKGNRLARGWPWRGGALGQGYDSKTFPWGFGNTILAVDVKTKKILWKHQEKERLDTRAACLSGNRLFFFSHGNFLGCLDIRTGKELWRTSDAELMKAIGEHKFAQNPLEGFSTTCYVKCNEDALYFAGPIRTDLVAVSAKDGKLLWKAAGRGNSQLVLREDGLYAMSPGNSTRFDFLSGKVLSTLGPRVNCTRATGSIDSIFVRGGRDGTIRYNLTDTKQQHICPMRPSCQDGVIASFGHLYWGPWMCDCNLTLVGVISLEPAGDFNFDPAVKEKERLEVHRPNPDRVAELTPDASDWPTLRANNQRSGYVPVSIAEKTSQQWSFTPKVAVSATAPITAGNLVFVGSNDGSIRALDAASGKERWTFYTGATLTYPPAIWQKRLYAGSGDGWIYALEAKTGNLLWRFRAAPVERTIPVYGSLRSTWPVASGVLVEDGVVYAAAGLANHDGTHLYALDAITGKLRWHNGSSGSIHPQTAAGVSVNGHLLLHDRKLHLAGGNAVAVASYDLASGKCLVDPQSPGSHTQFQAGSDLFVDRNKVMASGFPLYSTRGDYRMVNQIVLSTKVGDVIGALGVHNSTLGLVEAGAKPGTKPIWTQKVVSRILGLAVTENAVVVAGTHDPVKKGETLKSSLLALSLKDGAILWQHTLPAQPASWGLAVNRDGQAIVTLEDGRVLCYGAKK
jgi:outer membrane protein assembly factor BamB